MVLKLYKVGKFYNTYNNDSYIIHYYTGYKIIKNNTCGFPDSALNKVTNTLTENNISYIIYEKDKELSIKNNYQKVLKKSIKSLELEKRIKNIESKLEIMNESSLSRLLDKIENAIK